MTTPNRRIGNDTTIDVTPRSAFVLKKKIWIPVVLIFLLFAAMATSHYLGKSKTAPPAPQVSVSEAQQLRKENEGLKKDFEDLKKVLATRQAEAAPLAPPVAVKPVAPVTDQVSPKGEDEVDLSKQSVKVEFVPYDPKRHTPQKNQPYRSGSTTMHTFGGDEPPAFSVKETTEKVRTDKGVVKVRPVFVAPGIPMLVRNEEDPPRLKDSSLTPYPLNVWDEGTGEYRAHWFAK